MFFGSGFLIADALGRVFAEDRTSSSFNHRPLRAFHNRCSLLSLVYLFKSLKFQVGYVFLVISSVD